MKTSVTYGEILPFLKVYKVYWKSFKTNRSKRMAMTWKVELSERERERERKIYWDGKFEWIFLEDLLQNSLDHVTDVQH